MEHTSNHIDELIAKYLAGETSREEHEGVVAWVNESDANRKYFEQLQAIFQNASSVKTIPHFDTDEAWRKMRSRLHSSGTSRVTPMTPWWKQNIYRIAAGFLVFIIAGIFVYNWTRDDAPATLEVVSDNHISSDTLPDGSDVTLNKETTLAYTYSRKQKQHTVKLKGEAYFNIQHNDNKTFVVEAGETLIKDIGTSFNVKAYPEQNTIEVVVEEGAVMFYTANDTGIYLEAGGKGIYHKTSKTFTVEQAEPNVTAYKTRFFIFSDAELGHVVDELNSVYDRKINIDDHLRSCRLTVSFNNESIDEIAGVIAETLGLTLNAEGNNISLQGAGCNGN